MTSLAILKKLTYCILFKSDANGSDTTQFISKIIFNYKNYILLFGEIQSGPRKSSPLSVLHVSLLLY